MSSPVVVQGTAVNNTTNNDPVGSHAPAVGEKQETKCRDPLFAVLFYITLIAITALAIVWGPAAVQQENDGSTETTEYGGYVIATVIVAFLSFFGAGGGMALLMWIPEFLIKAALIFVVAMSGLSMILAFASGAIGLGLIGLVFFAMFLCYARAVWSRIPWATSNLVTACTAIKSNLGVAGYAYILTFVGAVWSIVWTLAFVGSLEATHDCNDVTGTCKDPSYGLLFILFVAFFFVQQVVQNCIHVTVAGMVGNWWFEPSEASCCCSPAVNNSFLRTVTTSFGSICFGSLLVAILRALEMLARSARENGDAGIGACIAECIISCLANIIEYFNKWAFIYVGLYGFGYIEAGKNVMTLFKNRGWEAIIADSLIADVLMMISIVVGLFMGAVAVLVEVASGLLEDEGGNEKAIAYFLGFIVGTLITSILMSTIGSAVNAVIVLFAEAPQDFQRNYPELSNRMRETWSTIYPGSI